jgi:PadR family transcriptional regulator, regulatory protein PadR
MQQNKDPVLPGTLNLMILKTLETLGPLHGYGIARRIEQISADRFQLNQGTMYPALLDLMQMGWISSKWACRKTTVGPGITPLRVPDGNSLRPKKITGGKSLKF